MRIKRIECEQFAGLLDKDIEFEKGLNILVGNNECGKSTIVDLIYQMLFKDVKLDGRSDADFIDKYFPKKINGPQGDVIDGVIVFVTASGTYKLKKEWEKGEGICRLTLPNGSSIKGIKAISDILKDELVHRAGVYSEIVFASQKRNQLAVESIMRALGKKSDDLSETRSDLTSTLTQAALETGGVSLEKIEKSLEENLTRLGGRWDFMADAPEGGAKRASFRNAWDKGAGTITKAYYAVDEIRSKQTEAENAERQVEALKSNIQTLREKKKAVEKERASFQKFRGLLGQIALLHKAIDDLDMRLKEQEKALERWPLLISNREQATKLQKQKEQAVIHDLFLKAEPVQNELQLYVSKLDSLMEVSADDLKQARNLINLRQAEEGKLAGMNIAARIRKLGDATIEVKNIASGTMVPVGDEDINISEAVEITVPGVMEMQLMPQGIDVPGIRAEIDSAKAQAEAIYEKYKVNDFDKLQEMYDSYQEICQKVEQLKLSIARILGNVSWEQLKEDNEKVPEGIETENEINKKISELCGSQSVDSYIGGLESTISSYTEKYISIEQLTTSIARLIEEKNNTQHRLDTADDIPEEFAGIEDADVYDEDLQTEIEDYDNRITDADTSLHDAEMNLGDKSAEEYSDELSEKELALETLKKEYEHWKNIYDIFCETKDRTLGNPTGDIAVKFNEYLQIISDGSLKLDSMDETMMASLASGDYALSYDILSEGTRDTISLAFRLAMLEHLFPEGDGLAIFDDPFTDMDPDRVDRSCKLLQKYAEKNQVIFVTCDSKYQKLMDANVILVSRV